ncbi:MAG: gluconate 2-dehydrogenase subunit 3 family protein [Acidobacteria bacterium]|nr:gluconate 2-dehydrogenase subunit 3 family protein [Acidobacteriota bacterium]MDA1233295.1 gluconate 2-dehydrogenase subunit 3 family protein [Acidobacteriota bacterium]
MNRRDLIRSAVLGAGAASVAGAQQHQHTQLTTIAPAQAAATATEPWTPAILDEHQNATVIQLSELIIPTTDTPGAKDAKVNEWVDLYLKDLAEDKGHSFIMGLGWLDGYSNQKHSKPFVGLSEPQQVAILEELDGATADELLPGKAFFNEIKRLTVQGYYTSRIGISELNKDGVPSTYACTHDSHA